MSKKMPFFPYKVSNFLTFAGCHGEWHGEGRGSEEGGQHGEYERRGRQRVHGGQEEGQTPAVQEAQGYELVSDHQKMIICINCDKHQYKDEILVIIK